MEAPWLTREHLRLHLTDGATGNRCLVNGSRGAYQRLDRQRCFAK